MEADLKYYRRRSTEEAAAAASADDVNVRTVHLELARRYEERISSLQAQCRRAEMHVVNA